MIRFISHVVSWGCVAIIVATATFGLLTLINIAWLAELARNNLSMPIQWDSVEHWQWYGFWVLLMLVLLLGSVGLFFLHRAYARFAKGELFNVSNSINIKRFAVLALAQIIAKPIAFALASVILSLNHPVNHKVLAISFGSQELITFGIVMILWSMSELLLVGNQLQSENQQFV